MAEARLVINPALLPQAQACRLLALPAEIRDYIWALAFMTDTETKTDLLKATGPSFALLATCHQIHSESKWLFQKAKTEYWPARLFTIDGRPYRTEAATYASIEHLSRVQLKLITRLSIEGDDNELRYNNGVWDVRSMHNPPRMTNFYGIFLQSLQRGTIAIRCRTKARKNSRAIVAALGYFGRNFSCEADCLVVPWDMTDDRLAKVKEMIGYTGLTRRELLGKMESFKLGRRNR